MRRRCVQCNRGAVRPSEAVAEELSALGMRACGALAAERRAAALLAAHGQSPPETYEAQREHARRIDGAVVGIAHRGPNLLAWSLELSGWCRPCAARAAVHHSAYADGTARLPAGPVEDRPDTWDAATRTATPEATLCRRCGAALTEGRYATALEVDDHTCLAPAPRPEAADLETTEDGSAMRPPESCGPSRAHVAALRQQAVGEFCRALGAHLGGFPRTAARGLEQAWHTLALARERAEAHARLDDLRERLIEDGGTHAPT